MNEESVFRSVLARPIEERDAYLAEVCAGRPDLRAAVEGMLSAQANSIQPLDSPTDEFELTEVMDPGSHQGQARKLLSEILERTETGEPPESTSDVLDHPRTVAFDSAIAEPQTAKIESQGHPLSGVSIAGRYVLDRMIGEGGMGDVWVARQTEPVKRRVALKLLKTGMDSKVVLQRFEQERQALAMMDHPNIASVLDAGITQTGQPFFVMELVNGQSLTKFCDEKRLTLRERLELFVPICNAVQHAHQKGIIHRDLKPANILVTLIDGKPVPKVIDFGVAKATSGRLTDESMATEFGALIGTLEYMSPEQAGFAGDDIDTRTDIYSLGVILYELLTGLRPIDSRTARNSAVTEVIRIIREVDPAKPSSRVSNDESLPFLSASRKTEPKKLRTLLQGDLDWIVMKCLEKSRDRRYETANGLARDIQRFLANEPVEACPPSVSYRLSKFARKHRTGLAMGVAFAALLAMATAISTWQAFRAYAAEQKAERERVAAVRLSRQESLARKEAERANSQLSEAQRILNLRYYGTRMNLAQFAFESNDIGRVRNLLDQVRPRPGEPDLRGFEWDYWLRLCHQEQLVFDKHPNSVQRVVYSPGGDRIGSADWNGRVMLWDAASGKVLLNFEGHTDRINGLAFSPDGKRLATASSDMTIKVWDARSANLLLSFRAYLSAATAVAFSPDGERLVTGSATDTLTLWNASDGRRLHQVDKAHRGIVTGIKFSSDGLSLASSGTDGFVNLWNSESLSPVRSFSAEGSEARCIDFSPDGRFLVTGYFNADLIIWEVATGDIVKTLRGHEGAIYGVAFAPGKRQFASVGSDRTVRIWNLVTGREIRRFLGHVDLVTSIDFSPDGNRIATGAFDKTVRIWDLQRPDEPLTINGDIGRVNSVAFSPDGRSVAFGGDRNVVEIRDASTGIVKHVLTGHKMSVNGLAFSPDGRHIASGGADKSLLSWDVDTGRPELKLEGLSESIDCVAYSPDGRYLVADLPDDWINLRDAKSGKLVKQLHAEGISIRSVAFSPDGRILVGGDADGVVRTWELETGKPLLVLESHTDVVDSVVFSHDGRWIASSGKDGTIRIRDAKTGREVRTLKGHSGRVRSIAFTPDDRRLASASEDRTVKLFDTESGDEVLTLKGHGGWVFSLAFSPDGKRLATGGFDRTVKVWNAEPR